MEHPRARPPPVRSQRDPDSAASLRRASSSRPDAVRGKTLLAIAAAALGAGLSYAIATPENGFVQFPWHHDDFSSLAYDPLELSARQVRPVAFVATGLLARFGPGGTFLGLQLLVALFLGMSTLWATRTLDLRLGARATAASGFLVGYLFLLFEASPWVTRYTGHLTNAVSSNLGMAACLLALRMAPPSGLPAASFLLLYSLSIFAKEDFLLFPCVPLAAGLGRALRRGDRQALRFAAMLAACALLVGAMFTFNGWAGSPFTRGSGPYRRSFAPEDLAASFGFYLGGTPMLGATVAALVSVAIASCAIGVTTVNRWLVVGASLVALIAPYAPLSAHRFEFYAYNWLPPMLAVLVCASIQLCRKLRSRPVRFAFSTTALVALIAVHPLTYKPRRDVARQIQQAQERSRSLVRLLRELWSGLGRPGLVGVEGTGTLPWYASNGRYLNTAIGGDVRWIVLLREGSSARRFVDEAGWPREWGAISVGDDHCQTILTALGVPVLLETDAGVLALVESPSGSESPGTTSKVDAGAPESDAFFCGGWSPPAGVGAGAGAVRWPTGTQALLVVALPRDQDLDLVFDFAISPGTRTQMVDLAVDGLWIQGKIVPSTGGPVSFRIPASESASRATVLTLGGLRLRRSGATAHDEVSLAPPGLRSLEVRRTGTRRRSSALVPGARIGPNEGEATTPSGRSAGLW